jgi:hypothetical protein
VTLEAGDGVDGDAFHARSSPPVCQAGLAAPSNELARLNR